MYLCAAETLSQDGEEHVHDDEGHDDGVNDVKDGAQAAVAGIHGLKIEITCVKGQAMKLLILLSSTSLTEEMSEHGLEGDDGVAVNLHGFPKGCKRARYGEVILRNTTYS